MAIATKNKISEDECYSVIEESKFKIKERYTYLIIILISVSLFLPGIFLRDFWVFDEGRRALIALEMFRKNEWLIPRLLGKLILTKPPLFYWMEVIAFHITGSTSDWSARLPSVIAGIAGVIALFNILKQLLDRKSALIGVLAMSVSPIYFWMAQYAEPEMLFVATGLISMMFFCKIISQEKPSFFNKFCLYFFLSLSLMTKSPIMPLIIIFTIAIWIIIMKRGDLIKHLSLFSGTILFLAPILLWFLLLMLTGLSPSNLIREMMSHLDVDEALHSKSFLYYLTHLDTLMFPWSFLIIFAFLYYIFKFFKEGWKNFKSQFLKTGEYFLQGNGERFFLLIFFIVSILINSIVPSKRYYYGLILAPSASAIVALIYYELSSTISEKLENFISRYKFQILSATICISIILLMAGLLVKEKEALKDFSGNNSLNTKILLILVGVWFSGLSLILVLKRKIIKSSSFLEGIFYWAFCCMFFLASIFNFIIHPVINEQLSLKKSALEIKNRIPAEANLYSIRSTHTIWFYLGRTDIPEISDSQELQKYVKANPESYGVVYRKYQKIVDNAGKYKILYTSEYLPVERLQVLLFKMTE